MPTSRLLAVLTIVSTLFASTALAQAPQLDLLNDGNLIIGIVNTAQGAPAADTAITVQNLSQNGTITSISTDAAGVFIMTGEYETEYSFHAQIAGQSNTATIITAAAPAQPFQWPPIYITLAALGLLSLIPAHFLRRKDLAA
ncbi:MAG: hypothetical protein ACSHXZ_00830 [Gammaproteobacteria bacterium]